MEQILNFVFLNEQIATSGQPERDVFPLIKAAGYDLVIYMATPASTNHIPEEEQIVQGLGMRYVHIPVIWESPQVSQYDELVTLLEHNRGQKIYIHCALNYRVSAFMFLYRVLMLNDDPQQAWWDMLAVWEPLPHWRAYLRTVLAAHHAPPFAPLVETAA